MKGKFKIEGDVGLFMAIVNDVIKCAGDYAAGKNWDLEIGGAEGEKFLREKKSGDKPIDESIPSQARIRDLFHSKYSNLEKMLEPYLGVVGMSPPSDNEKKIWETYFKYFDDHKIYESKLVDVDVTSDFGTIFDLINIKSFFTRKIGRFKIIEIGGGYGRLAEAVFKLRLFEPCEYILLDAVPASIMYSYLYLKSRLPTARVGIYIHDEYSEGRYDFYIAPPWHWEAIAKKADLFINIQSFQEMTPSSVGAYFSLIEKYSNESAGAYFSNEFEYINSHIEFSSKSWALIFQTRSPRSWQKDSRTQVYKKNSKGHFPAIIDLYYKYQLFEFEIKEKILVELASQKGKSEYLEEMLGQLTPCKQARHANENKRTQPSEMH